ncbi:methyltransferase domain-containing protein [Pedobacter sp. PLR]|uniref:methyltransferase domain-containing protein n=1 Tax=Pedobacter sp. PLR TaxID=2994465 RepID=UPI002247CE3A|nr:methyltransferase domain-containing protein [Pedobacter sp. PLR]MCX2454072.1 methyltransferase domain-containing protein [Pedobacter sp. PLR]
MIDTRYRSDLPEIMDNFSMEGEILKDALDKIAGINQLLGGNKVTLVGVKELLNYVKLHDSVKVESFKKAIPTPKTVYSAKVKPEETTEISILDVGCGNGDMLRVLADYANSNHLKFKLKGIDANAFTVQHASQLSSAYENISYECVDVFQESALPEHYDIILCTLTLHHFKDPEIIQLLTIFREKARLGIVINDLQRSAIPYYLFIALCFVFRLNKMSKEDGLISILRGFKRKDLEQYSNQLKLINTSIRWKWAFRYQWIIPTI